MQKNTNATFFLVGGSKLKSKKEIAITNHSHIFILLSVSFGNKSCFSTIIQSNSVITNTTGPPIFVRYSRDSL
jgi:hypothetical protein